MECSDALHEARRHQGHGLVLRVHENHPELSARHLATGGFLGHAVHDVKPVLVEVRGQHLHPHDFAVESLGLVLRNDVPHHDGQALDPGLAVAQGLEEAHARLGHQGEQLGVVQMPALVDVADVDLQLGGKAEVRGKVKDDAGHGGLR